MLLDSLVFCVLILCAKSELMLFFYAFCMSVRWVFKELKLKENRRLKNIWRDNTQRMDYSNNKRTMNWLGHSWEVLQILQCRRFKKGFKSFIKRWLPPPALKENNQMLTSIQLSLWIKVCKKFSPFFVFDKQPAPNEAKKWEK